MDQLSIPMGLLFIFILGGIAVFLILVVLVQRGRGGGLAGALGGMGGQSAFGAKAGDTFTKITMWSAFIWIVLCVLTVKLLPGNQTGLRDGAKRPPAGMSAPAETESKAKSPTTPKAPTRSGGSTKSDGPRKGTDSK